MKRLLQRNIDKVLHWNMAFVGGFMGTYAIVLHGGNFGSAQTGNVLEMAEEITSFQWGHVLIRLLAAVIFGTAVILSYLMTNYTKINMWKLALLVDAAGLTAAALIPTALDPVIRLYPIFFCAAFQWGTYSGAAGYNSASIFITNNFKQSLLAWTQFVLTKDRAFSRKAVVYTFTVLSFLAGACVGCISVYRFDDYGAFVGIVPLISSRIFLSLGDMAEEDGTPEETEKEAEEEMKEARLLEEEKRKK